MQTSFNVYPTRGFLNTSFCIRANESIDYSISFNNNMIYEGTIAAGETCTLPALKDAGVYVISTTGNQERQRIYVEDAIRLGTSELKKAYVFDNFPYIVFVMRDRIHFYDPVIETYVYSENFLSPNEVYAISSTKLLFVSEHSEGISLSVFDTTSFSQTYKSECEKLIAYSKDYNTIYAINANTLSIIKAEDLSDVSKWELNDVKCKNMYWIDKEKNLLFFVDDTNIYCININSGELKSLGITNAIGVTSNGFLIKNQRVTSYSYESLNPSCEVKGSFTYNPLYNNLTFEGKAIKNERWNNHIEYSISKYLEDNKNEIIERCLSQAAGANSKFVHDNGVSAVESSAAISFYPGECGIYIKEDVHIKTLHYVTYNINDKEFCDIESRTSKSYNARLVWIGNNGLIKEYNSISYSMISAIMSDGNKASISLDEGKSSLLVDGNVVETFEDKWEAISLIGIKNNTKKQEIIIDGIAINDYKVVCRSNGKLVIRDGEQYKYYSKGNNNEWVISKVIDFKEEKHTRAAMSQDGKYLVYSKGGNKYVLYNIETQKEETVLTGNFVDFDKSGNLVMSDRKSRQLRIYDPVTFAWVKDIPQYYQFVSPDGKLYAKTSRIPLVKYFSKIDNHEISTDELKELKKKYNKPTGNISEQELEQIQNRRLEFINLHSDYFDNLLKEINYKFSKNKLARDANDFIYFFVKKTEYVVIGVCGSDVELKIELGMSLAYLNYISFSYDNKYVAIVGKPDSDGYLQLVKIDFNGISNTLTMAKEICAMKIARRATWTCAFTPQGLLGTYDSIPNLYLIPQNQHDKFNDDTCNDYNYLKEHFCIKDRSLMCFSPSGKYMALSVQGYEPFSLGGQGHVPSNKMFIYSTDDYETLDEWEYQGSNISKLSPSDPYKKNLIQAGFSIDDNKIMTVSGDGVVVVRNLNLDRIEESKKADSTYLA